MRKRNRKTGQTNAGSSIYIDYKRGKKECIWWLDWLALWLAEMWDLPMRWKECKETWKGFGYPVGNFTGGLLPGIYEKRRFDCKIPFT